MSSNDDTYVFNVNVKDDVWQVRWHGEVMPFKFNHVNPAHAFLDQLRAAEQSCLTGKQQAQ